MLINLKELANKGTIQLIKEQADLSRVLGDRSDLISYSALDIQLEARHVSKLGTDEVHVDGKLSFDVAMPCSRCLKTVDSKLDVPFHEVFVKTDKAVVQEDEYEFEEEDDDDILYVTEDKVDLMPYVIEYVLLSLPFAPLCDDACIGLCPVCGTDRNVEPCSCSQEKIDPRLAGLADFFKQ